MADGTVNNGKRRFLIGATSAVGGIGVAAAATPFVMSFFPSERAKAAGAPVEVDISKLEPGQKIDVEWRGKVVWIRGNAPDEEPFVLLEGVGRVADVQPCDIDQDGDLDLIVAEFGWRRTGRRVPTEKRPVGARSRGAARR